MKSIHPFVAAGVVLIAAVHVLDPPVIGTVNLERVFNDIQARNQAEDVLQAEIKLFEIRQQALRAAAKRHTEDLDMLVPGTDKYDTVQKQHMQDVLNYSAMGEFIQYKLDATRAEARRQLFNEVIDRRRCSTDGATPGDAKATWTARWPISTPPSSWHRPNRTGG